jgi:hypothetical protein
MKRRTLLLRTMVGSASAFVVGLSGWLMGTRSLTMPPPEGPTPPPWSGINQTYISCANCPAPPDQGCWTTYDCCIIVVPCSTATKITWYGCPPNQTTCSNGWCRVSMEGTSLVC